MKSLTICKLPNEIPRRVDFLYSPPDEYYFALLYFTGSKVFNTIQRQKALDLGYTLSEDLIFGRIVFRHVGGEPDPDGEYLVRLEGSRLKAGPGGGELPRSLVRLVSGGIYSITYTGRDSADNFVSEFIIPNVRFDNIKPFIVLTKPSATQTVFDSYKWPYTNSEKVTFTLSENLKESVEFIYP